MANQRRTIQGTFTGTGNSDTLLVRSTGAHGGSPNSKLAQLVISGTWVGTVNVQGSVPGAADYNTMTNGSFTANTLSIIEFPSSLDVRINCSAYTSGTIKYYLVIG